MLSRNRALDTLLVLPAYNEAENIGWVLDSLRDAGATEYADVLVVDDGSSDDTGRIAKRRGFEVVTQVYNMGYGAALQTAYKYATDKGYSYLIQMDADGQHDIANIDIMLAKLKRSANNANGPAPDIVIGSRFLEGAQSFSTSPIKRPIIAMFRWIVRRVTGTNITDPTSGLWGINRRTFRYLAVRDNFDIKYSDVNMILQMLMLGYRIEEVPAIMHERVAGASMHTGVRKALIYGIVMSFSTWGAFVRCNKKMRRLKAAKKQEAK